jgi:hypothetical protein
MADGSVFTTAAASVDEAEVLPRMQVEGQPPLLQLGHGLIVVDVVVVADVQPELLQLLLGHRLPLCRHWPFH